MKILFNCSNNSVGGAVQNAVNFIKIAITDKRNSYFFVVSKSVFCQISHLDFNKSNFIVASKPFFFNKSAIDVRLAEKKFEPDIIYTMAGPSFVFFKNFHYQGISDPYITHAENWVFFHNRKFFSSIKLLVSTIIKRYFSLLNTDLFLFQTSISQNKLKNKFLFKNIYSSIIPNAVSLSHLSGNDKMYRNFVKSPKIKYFLVPSALYPHKSLDLILKIINSLIISGKKDFIFLLTLDSLPSQFSSSSNVINLGSYKHEVVGEIYNIADYVFLPSVLETFSTTYIEAMYLNIPLITPDFDFVRCVCGEYPIYYDHFNQQKLFDLFSNILEPDYIPTFKSCENYSIINQQERYNMIVDLFDANNDKGVNSV